MILMCFANSVDVEVLVTLRDQRKNSKNGLESQAELCPLS